MGKAGRPFGSTSRPQLRKYLTHDQIEDFAKWLIKEYKKKPELAKWLGDQIFGKAVQPIGGDEENPIKVQITGMKIIQEDKEDKTNDPA